MGEGSPTARKSTAGGEVQTLRWEGKVAPHLEQPHVDHVGRVTLGCCGGNRAAGARKNEDAALIWASAHGEWTFAALCDAHGSSQSAELVLNLLDGAQKQIVGSLSLPVGEAFAALEDVVLRCLRSPAARQQLAAIQGETALLLCAQRGRFVWWLSVGDNLIYLLHPELASLGQYALNQRHFFEWTGQVDSLALAVSCYTRGVSELRRGQNQIVMLTDGVLEFGERFYEEPRNLYEKFCSPISSDRPSSQRIHRDILGNVQQGMGRDSATIISFVVDNGDYQGSQPSA